MSPQSSNHPMAFTYLSPICQTIPPNNILATLGQNLLVSPVPLWVTRRKGAEERKWGSDHVETLRNKRVLAEWGDLGGCQWLAMVGAKVMIDDGHNFHWLTGVQHKDLVT